MNWPVIYPILFVVILLIAFWRTKRGRRLLGQTWFGFLLILVGLGLLLGTRDHLVLRSRRIGGTTLESWQIKSLGLFGLGFGINWVYGPLRRWFRSKKDDDNPPPKGS